MSGQNSSSRRHRRYHPLAVLAAIAAYQQLHHRSPSERRIQADLGISAPSVVHNLLRRLRQDGLLTTTSYGRGHRAEHALTSAGQTAVGQWQTAQAEPTPPESRVDTQMS